MRGATIAAVAVVLAALALAACGSSGGGSPTASSAAAATQSTSPGGIAATIHSRMQALRSCLTAHGVKLTPGTLHPTGITPQEYQAALRKCGARSTVPTTTAPAGGPQAFSPALKRALLAFAACMRSHGIPLPAPNTTGTGAIFNSRGIDTHSAKFQAAAQKCRALLASPQQ
jgi:hypothetical protein